MLEEELKKNTAALVRLADVLEGQSLGLQCEKTEAPAEEKTKPATKKAARNRKPKPKPEAKKEEVTVETIRERIFAINKDLRERGDKEGFKAFKADRLALLEEHGLKDLTELAEDDAAEYLAAIEEIAPTKDEE